MAFRGNTILYLLDYGDFVKIGQTQRMQERFCIMNRKIEQDLNLEGSYIWYLYDGESRFLEGAIVKKYSQKRFEHPYSKTEIFVPDAKLPIIEDIQTTLDLLEIKHDSCKVSEVFEYRKWKSEKVLYFIN